MESKDNNLRKGFAMSFWKLATETIGTKGVMVMIAIAGTFYVSSHISEFKADINTRFNAMDARFDKQDEFLMRMFHRMDRRLLDVELMALINRKDHVLAMPASEERAKLISQLDKEIRRIEQLKFERKYDLSDANRQ